MSAKFPSEEQDCFQLEVYIFLSLKIDFIIANIADPDEIPQYAAFHLSIHCLPKYLFNVIQKEKGERTDCVSDK